MNRTTLLKLLLWVIGLFHLILGLVGAFLGSSPIRLFDFIFNAVLPPTALTHSYIKYISAYAIGYGLLAVLSATDLKKYRIAIIIVAVVLLIRFTQTLLYHDELIAGFQLNMQAIVFLAIIKLGLGSGLLLLNKKNE